MKGFLTACVPQGFSNKRYPSNINKHCCVVSTAENESYYLRDEIFFSKEVIKLSHNGTFGYFCTV